MSKVKEGDSVKIAAVGNDEKFFLDHLNSKGQQIGDIVTVKASDFDRSVTINRKG